MGPYWISPTEFLAGPTSRRLHLAAKACLALYRHAPGGLAVGSRRIYTDAHPIVDAVAEDCYQGASHHHPVSNAVVAGYRRRVSSHPGALVKGCHRRATHHRGARVKSCRRIVTRHPGALAEGCRRRASRLSHCYQTAEGYYLSLAHGGRADRVRLHGAIRGCRKLEGCHRRRNRC